MPSKTTTPITMRVSNEIAERYRSEARMSGRTLAEHMHGLLQGVSSYEQLMAKCDDLKWELDQLRKQTGKKVPKTHRVGTSLDAAQFKAFSRFCAQRNLTKSVGLREIMGGVSGETPQLSAPGEMP